jgi:methionine-rich copper-binding protein CopC
MSRSLSLLLLLPLLLVLWAAPARAHGVLVTSDPPDGAALAGPPSTATLAFNEPLGPTSLARLVDGQGKVLVDRATVSDTTMKLELPSLGPGAYGLAWRVLTPRDGHVTEGLVLFTVGTATVVGTVFAPPPESTPSGWPRLLLIALLVCGLGLAARSVPVFPASGETRRRLLVIAAAVVLLAAWPRQEPPPAAVASGTAVSGDLLVSVSVTAGGACTVTVASSRRPAPAPVDLVTLGVTPLRPLGAGRYVGTGVRGDRATLVVHRGGHRLELPLSWSPR